MDNKKVYEPVDEVTGSMKYYLIGIQDNEARLLSETEFNKLQKSVEELDGFEGFTRLGEFNDPRLSEVIMKADEKGYQLSVAYIDVPDDYWLGIN